MLRLVPPQTSHRRTPLMVLYDGGVCACHDGLEFLTHRLLQPFRSDELEVLQSSSWWTDYKVRTRLVRVDQDVPTSLTVLAAGKRCDAVLHLLQCMEREGVTRRYTSVHVLLVEPSSLIPLRRMELPPTVRVDIIYPSWLHNATKVHLTPAREGGATPFLEGLFSRALVRSTQQATTTT